MTSLARNLSLTSPLKIVALAGAVALASACDPPPEKPAPESTTPPVASEPLKGIDTKKSEFAPCKGDDCLVVPEGIAGTVFGMTQAAAKERFGKLRKLRSSKRWVEASRGCRERKPPPEQRFKAKTTLGGEKADCELSFVADGLVRIACKLDGKRDATEHAETAHVLFLSLTKQYGTPQGTVERLATNGLLNASWKNDAATLEVVARHRGSRSTIRLENVSARLAASYEDEKAEIAARCKAKAEERALSAAEREERLREKAREFEKDLRPPLEKPKTE